MATISVTTGSVRKNYSTKPVSRIPMLVYDPDPAADATRGTTDERLVEGLDLLPIFLDALGADLHPHRLEGRSLLPLLRPGETTAPGVTSPSANWTTPFGRRGWISGWPRTRRAPSWSGRRRGSTSTTSTFAPHSLTSTLTPTNSTTGRQPGACCQCGRHYTHGSLPGCGTRRTRTTIADTAVAQRTAATQRRGILIGVW